MNIAEIISSLSPINSNEKVDELVRMIHENGIKVTKEIDLEIRLAIRKSNTQAYYLKKHSKWKNLGDMSVNPSPQKEKSQKSLPAAIKPETKAKKKKDKKEKKIKIKKKKNKVSTSGGFDIQKTSLRVFTKSYQASVKKRKASNRKGQSSSKSPIATSSSVHTISIAFGGMNKRY